MRLSHLQKYILLECLQSRTGRISRTRLNLASKTKIITKSIKRLIDKELLVGFGQRTKYKWFIKEIKLTALGKKQAKKLLGEQLRIKFSAKGGSASG